MQFGLLIIPFGRSLVFSPFTSGTTSGTPGSIRNAPELSTAMAPRAAAIGAHCAETSSGTSNMATSTPSNTSGASACTVTSSPRTINFLPALRADAINLISPQTSSRSVNRPSITVPTAPVAPTTASVGFFAIIVPFHHKQPLHHQHLSQTRCELLALLYQCRLL
ncbi:unannotated protein [freshwater metagenome]|uniref:Unannotated protein n=1 Tax=freshwater metagenome TaxID=449393 RepID=A0A6J6F0F6_9ZZZZ